MTDLTAGVATTGATISNKVAEYNRCSESTTEQPSTDKNGARHIADQVAPYQPTIRDLILQDLPTDIKISPNGRHVAVTVRTTNWHDNRYETICYLYPNQGSNPTANTHRGLKGYPLHRTGSVQQVEWLNDETVALLKSNRGGDAQLWLYEGLVGEGWQITEHRGGVKWFAPFGTGIIYGADREANEEERERAETYGTYREVEHEESRSALFYVGIAALRDYMDDQRRTTPTAAKRLVRPVIELSRVLEHPCSIRSVVPCPTNKALYLNCWRRDDLVYYNQSSNFQLCIDPESALAAYLAEETKCLQEANTKCAAEHPAPQPYQVLGDACTVAQLKLPRAAEIVAVSPDGNTLLIDHQGRDEKIYTRSDLWLLEKDSALKAESSDQLLKQMRNISAQLDRDLFHVQWHEAGIFAAYVDHVHIRVVNIHLDGSHTVCPLGDHYCAGAFDVGKGGAIAFIGTSEDHTPDAYLALPLTSEPTVEVRQITTHDDTSTNWQVGSVETIRWQSKDGTDIEGVLRKPANFDPNRRYPLVFVVHGGPRGYADASRIAPVDRSYYPAIQFANADILVLYPNYRGSTGRGQAFTELNVDNLGIGDLWDLESAIDYLCAQGWVDETRIGCMGWSQGGYISAFAGLHSKRFRAVSVGAGISDWYTYHISNDIPYFTTDYLSGSPFHNREHYAPTAPISNITNAETPMLIQHGEDDQRVPLSNGMELYRGLQAMKVPVKLYVYPGMGHPITKPRENHAVMSQNLEWFTHYLLE